MARWQRTARVVLAIFAIGVIAVVAYTMRPREVVAPPATVERADPKAVAEVHNADAIQLKGASQDIRVESKLQTTDKEGEVTLHDVKISVSNRGGRSYVVTGKQAFIGKDQSSFDVRGEVKLETDDGLTATSQQASYTNAEKIVRVPGAVKFAQRRMTGSGVGFTFDEQRDVMEILDQADVDFAAEKDLEPMSFTAGWFAFARRDRYMRFEKTMHMDREGQQIDADSAMVRMFPDRDEPDYVELRNGSRITGGGASSALRAMTARDINLDYMDDGRTLQNATLAGNAEIQVAPKRGSATQKLAGDYMDINMDPDGSLRALSTRDRVVVTLPATKELPARTVRSNSLVAIGNANGIRQMTFSEGVEYREPGPKGQAGRTVRARTLEAGLDAAAGTLQEAHFVTNVDFSDGPLHATGADARYMVEAGTLALSGAPRPHVESDTLTIDANTVDVTLNPRKMVAKGNVGTTLLPPKKASGNAASTKRPALLGDKDPVNVISAALTYDEATKEAEFTGGTRLIQGQTSINATTLTLDETKGDLTANGKVVTNLVIASGKEESEAPAAPQKPTIARAETFTYSDQTRMATYTTAAQLNGEQGNLSAGKLELHLAKNDNALERLDADGAVTAKVDRRSVTATRLTFTPSDDKYAFAGAPVKMIDADCQETSGKTLQFWKGSDRVVIDGNNQVRTQTKGGGKCTPVPQ